MKNKNSVCKEEIDFEMMHRVVNNGKVIRLRTGTLLKRFRFNIGSSLFRLNEK